MVTAMMLFTTNVLAENYMDSFTIRDGITFGMTKSQVESMETATPDVNSSTQLNYKNIKIANLKDCKIHYCFDNEDILKRVEIDLYPEMDKFTLASHVRDDYTEINNLLIAKCGTPLGYKDGQTYSVRTTTLELHLSMDDLNKALIRLMGGNQDSQYDEWVIRIDEGYVKVEHVFSYILSQGNSVTFHSIAYEFYSEEELQQEINDFTKGI